MDTESIFAGDAIIHIKKSVSGKALFFCDSIRFVLVPESVYKTELKEQFFGITHKLLEDELIIENKISNNESILLACIKKDVYEKIRGTYKEYDIFHFVSALVSIIDALNTGPLPAALVNIQDNHFYLLLKINNKLVLVNSFSASNANDTCYFFLNSLRQTNILQNPPKLWYSGKVSEKDTVIQLLSKYTSGAELIRPLEMENTIGESLIHFPSQ